MNPPDDSERVLFDYLLGRLPEGEALALQGRLLEDDGLDEELLAATDDLIRAYLEGALPDSDRERFESHFLAAPDHEERLRFVRALREAARRAGAGTPSSRRSFRPALLAAAAALAMIAVWTGWPRHAPAPGPPVAAVGPLVSPDTGVSPRSDPSPAGPSPADSPPGGSPLPSDSGPGRGRDVVRVAVQTPEMPVPVDVGEATRLVRLLVPVSGDSPSFDVALRAAGGLVVWKAEGLAPRGADQPIVLDVPARLLRSGRYVLQVAGERLRSAETTAFEVTLEVKREGASPGEPEKR